MLTYVSGVNLGQYCLLPSVIDDYIDADNICRVIASFVASLDLMKLGFKHAQLAKTGRPPYNPAMLLRLFIYGMLNRIRSSRKLEMEAMRNIEVMWLLHKEVPNNKTISNFRKDNAEAIIGVFDEFNKFCLKVGLFSGRTIAIDGTKIRANNNRKNVYLHDATVEELEQIKRKLAKQTEEFMQAMEASEAIIEEDEQVELVKENISVAMQELNEQKHKLEEIINKMEETGETQYAINDPDSRIMVPGGDGRDFDARYNVQCGVDAKNHLIVSFDVTNDCTDQGHIETIAIKAKETMEVETLQVLVDKGYYDSEDILKSEAQGVECYAEKPDYKGGAQHEGLKPSRFQYNKEDNTYTCPAGQILTETNIIKDGTKQNKIYTNRFACASCPLRVLCTKAEVRTITRIEDQDQLDKIAARLKENPGLYKMRGQIIEHVFGTIKAVWGYRNFLCRGKRMVQAEAALEFLAYNFRRVINIYKKNKVEVCFGA